MTPLGNLVLDLLLPKTDRAVLIQLLVVVPLFAVWIVRWWPNKDLRLFAIGVSVFTLSWFALRTLH